MGNNLRISVIIPVYNREDSIRLTLDSVLTQSYPFLQVILIDDGSQDRSLEICSEYQEKDSRVLVVHQENKGVSVARNSGLDKADGEWISFIDCGDYIEHDYYRKIMETANRCNADVVCTGTYKDSGLGRFVLETTESDCVILTRESALFGFFKRDKLTISVSDKIFKKEVLGTERFDISITHNEDALFSYRILKRTNRIVINSLIAYYYVFSPESTSRQNFSKKHMSIVKAQNLIFEDAVKYFPKLQHEAVKNYVQSLLTCLALAMKANYNVTEDIQLIQNRIRDNAVPYLRSDAAMGYKILVCVASMSIKLFDRLNK